jgi:SAM-dependent methyltransferase
MTYNYLWDQFNPSGYYNRMGFYKTKLELDFILRHVNANKQVILDIGGGSGRFAVPLIQNGHEVTVVDLNAEAIRLCKERGIKNAFCKDIRDLQPAEYNVVIAIELFLVTSPSEVFNAAYKQLKKDGIFIFVGTNKKSWRNKLHNLRKKKSKNLGELTIEEYKGLLNLSKFEQIDIKGFNWMPFRVNSNNILIPFFALIEKILKLGSWLNQSPWLLVACRKIGN